MSETKVNGDTIAKVHQNDPSVTSLVPSYDANFPFADQVAHSLGQALPQSDHVNSLSLSICRLTETRNYDALLSAIQHSATLADIALNGWRDVSSGPVADRFLQAISSSNTIQKVRLEAIIELDTNSFLSLLRSPVSALEMARCSFADTSERAFRDIAAGFADNQSLQSLELRTSMNDAMLSACVGALKAHPSLRHLTVAACGDGEYSGSLTAIGGILSSSSSILESLKLAYFEFSGAMFDPVARGVQSTHSTLTTLDTWGCSFDENVTQLFVDLFQTNDTIRTLKMDHWGRFANTTGTVISRILKKNAALETLLAPCHLESADCSLIFKALQTNTTLQILDMGCVDGRSLKTLRRGLPKLRGLKKLTFRPWQSDHVSIPVKKSLHGFQRNGSLEEVEIKQNRLEEEDRLFDAEALAKILSFCQRNKELRLLLAAPAGEMSPSPTATNPSNDAAALNKAFCDPALNLRLRPKAYVVAQKMEYGNDMIFRDLLCRAGDLVGRKSPSKRLRSTEIEGNIVSKRKRGQPMS